MISKTKPLTLLSCGLSEENVGGQRSVSEWSM